MTPGSQIAVVAGSGLNLKPILDTVCWEKPFEAFCGLSFASVAGHAGAFIQGMCGDVPMIVQQGRRHFYEGLRFEEVTAPVREFASLGVDAILFTNAAGGLKIDLKPGFLMATERIVTWPYRGWPDRPREIIPTWVVPECDATGAYAWVHGPSYETRAEIAALQQRGACAVGMSTAPEMAAAHALGIRTAALSCITNTCLQSQRLTHEEVLRTAQHTSSKLRGLLRRVLPMFAKKQQR